MFLTIGIVDSYLCGSRLVPVDEGRNSWSWRWSSEGIIVIYRGVDNASRAWRATSGPAISALGLSILGIILQLDDTESSMKCVDWR